VILLSPLFRGTDLSNRPKVLQEKLVLSASKSVYWLFEFLKISSDLPQTKGVLKTKGNGSFKRRTPETTKTQEPKVRYWIEWQMNILPDDKSKQLFLDGTEKR
jgi:hypothetical protein